MSQSIHFLGLDVHKESVAVSIAPSDATEVRFYGTIGGRQQDLDQVIKKLQAAAPDPSSATRPAGRVDCNSSAMAGLEAMLG